MSAADELNALRGRAQALEILVTSFVVRSVVADYGGVEPALAVIDRLCEEVIAAAQLPARPDDADTDAAAAEMAVTLRRVFDNAKGRLARRSKRARH